MKMLSEKIFEILESGWIIRLDDGRIGDKFSDTYKLEYGTPENIKEQFCELCELMESMG